MKSFNSIEISLDERLDPKRRIIGEAQLREHDQKKKQFPTSKFFQIEFSETVTEEIKSFLYERLQKILDFPEKFGMNIQTAGNLIRFVDKEAYETEVGTPLPKNISLPASRINYINSSLSFKVTIILPEKLDSAEAIINITRNLFSKLFGNIFLDEKIMHLNFFQKNLSGIKQITASVPEILDIALKLNLTSKNFDKQCESLAESYSLSMEKNGSEIRNQLKREWREKWQAQKLTKEEQHTIESMFVEFMESIRTNPDEIINTMIEHAKKLNTQLHYILPHERFEYEFFEKKHVIHYMRSIINKLEEISSLAGFIEELNSELENFSQEEELKGISTQIRYRMQQLIKEKKVIQFYVNEIHRNMDIGNIRHKFILVLIKMIPKGTPLKDWSKTVQQMEKHYSDSIYSKIYSALYCLSLLTSKEHNSKGESIKKSEAVKLLKKNLDVLKYHQKEIKSTLNVLGVLMAISEQSTALAEEDIFEKRNLFPLDEFKKAWSYFIASVLTLIFYKESANSAGLKQGFNAENYTKSILGYVDKQCSRGINYFHIVKLLWIIYDKKTNSDALKFLLFCLQNPNEILNFILHQVMLPQSENISLERRIEKLTHYGKVWVTSFQNRLDNAPD